MGEATRYFEDVNEGDEAPPRGTPSRAPTSCATRERRGTTTRCTTTRSWPRPRASRACSATACSRWACSAPPSPTTSGAGNLTHYQVRFSRQTWPGEQLTTRIVVTAKRVEDGRNLVDLECSLANGDGEVKVVGEATAVLPGKV